MSAKDPAWMFRTYAGHSTAVASNALYRAYLACGQTGLSVAFDLPTQTGYDSDHPLAQGEVGKVGVPVCHLGDMRALFADIPLAQMNTSMTINATAPWLLALYVALAEEQGVDLAALQGTVQNDIIKEYLSRGTYICPPAPSLAMISDVATWTQSHLPKWNPMNVCSYHLQEAGATPQQELAFALATATAVLDDLQHKVSPQTFPAMVGRISFFVNAGVRFVTELCKMRAFTELWDEICQTRYGITDPLYRRFRYGVQVNSLGLTGAVAAIEYMKSRLVDSNSARIAAIESGQTTVVGVNRWQQTEPSPLTAGPANVMQADPEAEAAQLERLADWTRGRDAEAARQTLDALRRALLQGQNIMPPSIACAKAGVTTGEWADVVRAVHGQFRAPTGVSVAPSNQNESLDQIRAEVDAASQTLGRRLKFLMCKPGLDGHSNGAEQISARARDCGMAFSYAGIRLTVTEIIQALRDEAPHVVGLSILSGSHMALMTDLLARLKQEGLAHIPVIVGGIIPDADARTLQTMGIARVYTPKDFELNKIMSDIIALATAPVVVAA